MAEPDPMVQLEAAIMARLGAAASQVSTDAPLAAALPGGVHSRTAGGETFPYLTLRLRRMDSDYTNTKPYRHRFKYDISVVDAAESIDAASAALERVYDLLHDATSAQMPMEDFILGYARRMARTGISPSQAGVTLQQITEEYAFEVYPI